MKHIVFDVSGVLRDTKQLICHSYAVAFAAHGVDVAINPDMVYKLRGLEHFNHLGNSIRLLVGTRGDIHPSAVSMAGANKLLFDEMNGRPVNDDLVDQIRTTFRSEFGREENRSHVTMLPGVEAGLERLASKYTLGVLSNSNESSLKRDLGHIAHYFKFIVSDANKPDPTVFLSQLAEHGMHPSEVFYVGDAVSDITLAKASGSIPIALSSGMGCSKHLSKAEPEHLFADFSEMTESLMHFKASSL